MTSGTVSGRGDGAGGFTLIEVLVATALLSTGIVAVAQLVVMVSRSNIASRDVSYAGVMASQKLAELVAGDPSTLAPTTPDAWSRSASHIDYLNAAGVVVATSGMPPGDAVYIRRWSITPLPADPSGGVVIQVAAGRVRRHEATGAPEDATAASVARAVGVRTGVAP